MDVETYDSVVSSGSQNATTQRRGGQEGLHPSGEESYPQLLAMGDIGRNCVFLSTKLTCRSCAVVVAPASYTAGDSRR